MGLPPWVSAALRCSRGSRPEACIFTHCSSSRGSSPRLHGPGVMADAVLLNIVLYLPLLGTAALLAVPSRRGDVVRQMSLAVMLVQFGITAWLYWRFDPAAGLQFETRIPWIPGWA